MSPQTPDILPFNIGIAPDPREIAVSAATGVGERLVLAGSPAGKTFSDEVEVGMDGPPRKPTKLILGDFNNGPAVPLVGLDGESLNSLTWPAYLAWRKTKTRPYDFLDGPREAHPSTRAQPRLLNEMAARTTCPDRAIEEIDQATAEMIGEVAELGELFIENGPTAFWGVERDKLIDECGDVFFCASWALDAWGENPLNQADDLEMIRISDDNELAAFAAVIGQNESAVALKNPRFTSMLGGLVFNLLLTAQTNAGLTANSYKKLKFQGREQKIEVQVARIANVLIAVNQILIVANSSVEEALKVNMRKLDARRPKGYDPLVPGGIRTGEGK